MSNHFIPGEPTMGMTPAQIVQELDKFIIGQQDAKRAVAVALRNRARRSQIEPNLRAEIKPKNILMIGPTGVGKTEIARRLATLANAPFIKVEATKFTEVGYVGRDVDSIIRDLTDAGVKMVREEAMEHVKARAMDLAEERILDVLLPSAKPPADPLTEQTENKDASMARQLFRKKLREGSLDEQEIEIKLSRHASMSVDIIGHPGMEEMTNQLKKMFQDISPDKPKKRKMRVKDALKALQEEEAMKLVNEEEIKNQALERVAQSGIVFIDEIDKIAQRSDFRGGAEVSREGVQRDLLPLIEGSTVNTKYGSVNTDHILFIASGAFHVSKPSDLIPELQGRLPIRVELDALKADDFVRILTEPYASLTMQVQILMATEKVRVEFTPEGIRRIAEAAFDVNERIENIGARRLHTIMERVIEDLSFNANLYRDKTVLIDENYVNTHLSAIMGDEDLSRFIL